MKTLGERISYLVESTGLNKSQFCQKYGFAKSSFIAITNDTRVIGLNIVKDLMVAFPNLNINWLIYGTGDVNYIKNGTIEDHLILKEPEEEYGDSFENLLLKYLDKKSIQNKILEITNHEKK